MHADDVAHVSHPGGWHGRRQWTSPVRRDGPVHSICVPHSTVSAPRDVDMTSRSLMLLSRLIEWSHDAWTRESMIAVGIRYVALLLPFHGPLYTLPGTFTSFHESPTHDVSFVAPSLCASCGVVESCGVGVHDLFGLPCHLQPLLPSSPPYPRSFLGIGHRLLQGLRPFGSSTTSFGTPQAIW